MGKSHTGLVALAVAALAACSSSSPSRDGAPDGAETQDAVDAGTPEASGEVSGDAATPGDTAGGDAAGGDAAVAAALSFVTPDVIVPGASVSTLCFYFHAPALAVGAIRQWTSRMDAGARALTLTYGAASQPADGTQAEGGCGFGEGAALPAWIYASTLAEDALTLPADDGSGKPLGMVVPAGQPFALQVRFVNPAAGPITTRARVDGYALPVGAAFTRTDAFVTYNASLNIPANAVRVTASDSCAVPAGASFWSVTTRARKQSITTSITDGTTDVFRSTDWENPGVKVWATTPFYTFASGKLTYGCTYMNASGRTIRTGSSPDLDEECLAIGYFFPSTGPKFCIDHTTL